MITSASNSVTFYRDLDLAKDILARNGATKVILYGSFARGDYNETSDIDLCAYGLLGINYFRAVGECLRDVETPVSVIPFANTRGYFRERILHEGRVIYELGV
jgi:predicted nucleotidyltransferase